VIGSLCDRSNAHALEQGLGVCVEPSMINTVNSEQEISDVLTQISPSRPYLAIPPKTFIKPLIFTQPKVLLIGIGNGQKRAKLTPLEDGPAISVENGANVTIQGLIIQNAKGIDGDGLYCQGTASHQNAITLIESTIVDSNGYGIRSLFCDVTLRRNILQYNRSGGAKLNDGVFAIDNNLVTHNGTLGISDTGGFSIYASAEGETAIFNNTVAYNTAHGQRAAGFICAGGERIYNTIVWDNIGSGQHLNCYFFYSDIQNGAYGIGNTSIAPQFLDETMRNFHLHPESKLIDKGIVLPKFSSIDLAGAPRIKGSSVDMGAYEVQ
jgi:hypothetical protein